VEWFSVGKKKFDIRGLATLWILLHHKLFTSEKTCLSFQQALASSLKSQFEKAGTLQYFLRLCEYGITSWPEHPPIQSGPRLWEPDSGGLPRAKKIKS
jgi:hypothetical protein